MNNHQPTYGGRQGEEGRVWEAERGRQGEGGRVRGAERAREGERGRGRAAGWGRHGGGRRQAYSRHASRPASASFSEAAWTPHSQSINQ